jgi:hypothetical protein
MFDLQIARCGVPFTLPEVWLADAGSVILNSGPNAASAQALFIRPRRLTLTRLLINIGFFAPFPSRFKGPILLQKGEEG